MSLKLSKSTIAQYLLLYLLLLTQGAAAILNNQQLWNLGLLGFAAIILLTNSYKIRSDFFLVMGGIVGGIIFTRFLNGGVGLDVLIQYCARVAGAYAFVLIDRRRCAERFIKTVAFFSVTSIVFFTLLNIVKTLLPIVLFQRGFTPNGVQFDYNFFFAYNHFGTSDIVIRNTSIYTEPALFAMVLIFAMYMCLYVPDVLNLSQKKISRYHLIFVITMITTMSTTGYAVSIVMYLLYIVQKSDKKMRKRIIIASICVLILAVLEAVVRKEDSIVLTKFIYKLFSEGDTGKMAFDLSAGTGRYRISAIATAWSVFLGNPLGSGYDKLMDTLISTSLYGSASSGGGLMREIAAFGLITSSALFYYLIKGAKKLSGNAACTCVFITCYVICTLSSSSMFYAVPILVASMGMGGLRSEEKSRNEFIS